MEHWWIGRKAIRFSYQGPSPLNVRGSFFIRGSIIVAKNITVLALGPPVLRQPKLLDAAVKRIAELSKDTGIVVFCPTPTVVSRALALAGLRAAAVSTTRYDFEFLQAIVHSGGVPVVDGGERGAIGLAKRIDGAKTIIYTDLKGVMSANPARIDDAVSVKVVSHVELMELADQRAGPLSIQAAHEASASGVECEIRNVTDDTRTVIRGNGYEDRSSPITSITVAYGYGLISMQARSTEQLPPWTALQMNILQRIAAAGISIEMVQSFPFILRFLAPSDRLSVMQALAQEYALQYQVAQKCAKICIVGTGVRSTAGVFYRSLSSLATRGVPVLHWSDSNVTLQYVVNESFARMSEKALHDALAPGRGISVAAPISFDADLGLVRIHGKEIRLGFRQAQMLRFLLDNVGRVVEAEELARHMFKIDGKDQIAAVRVHLHNLRKKIESDPESPRYIVTIPDQGYLLVR